MAFKNGMRPVHPGEVLREDYLKLLDLSVNALSKRLGIQTSHLKDVVLERGGVTPDTAMRLARYFGGDARSWLNLQTAHDLRVAEIANTIDDMRKARMEFNRNRFEDRHRAAPAWVPVAGVGFAVATFLSLTYLVLGPDMSAQKKLIFDVWVAFCLAASAGFLGGSAAASGKLNIPFLKDAPIRFSAIGGVAVFIVVFLIMNAANH